MAFHIREGNTQNEFLREGPVSGHLLLTSGHRPRLIAAFPAGNSGAGLFFKQPEEEVTWSRPAALTAVSREDRDGLTLHGLEAELVVNTPMLSVERVDVGSLRFLRNSVDMTSLPPRAALAFALDGRRATWSRARLDGKSRYVLTVEVLNGGVTADEGAPITLAAAGEEPLKLKITVLTGDAPLEPLDTPALLNADAADAARLRHSLAFLSYRQKLLAGSWRFLTYFGRDTLLSVRLLMPVLTPDAIEAGLASVIERTNGLGEVAHEEEIGELAVLRNLGENGQATDAPLYDYAMKDDNFMLAPVVAEYLLRAPAARARAFLRHTTARGESYGAVLARNARYVLASASPFARASVATNLIALKAGEPDGNWRDSEEGLAGGRYPYDVNAVFVPAALEAVAALDKAGLLREFSRDDDDFARAEPMAALWRREAPPHFIVTVPNPDAIAMVADHGDREGVPGRAALAAIGDEAVTFNAVALDAAGRPIPVLHSDDGFAFLFGAPSAAEIERVLTAMMRPFPAGLMTPVGLLVANPVFAPDSLRKLATRSHYHGAVIWSWQQALLSAGLERQLARADLPATTRENLAQAQRRLWQVIDATQDVRHSELWSWSFEQGRYQVAPFGQSRAHRTESNAAQLWSTVYLAVQKPPCAPRDVP
ncbi:MAG: hypothetical protein ACE5EM_09030 [Sphingomonadales bacterium]